MSNPTSNFGWQMPTNSDLVTDLPADFEVFGQAVDTSLADLKGGTTGQVLKKNSDTDMDFVWSSDSTGMTNPMTTTGDTIYSSSGSTPARLGIGTTGQVLTVSGGVPAWASPSSTIMQFKTAQNNTAVSTSSSTYVSTGISVSITPSSTSNKILLNLTGGGLRLYPNGQSCGMKLTFFRNGTNVASGLSSGDAISNYYTEGSNDTFYAHSTGFVDSPSSTSALTYEVYFLATNTNRAAYINAFSPTVGVVTLTAMEIKP